MEVYNHTVTEVAASPIIILSSVGRHCSATSCTILI